MYCELTSPGRMKRPGRILPDVASGNAPSPVMSHPAATISAASSPNGRCPSRSDPVNAASAPRAQATGSMKRRVEPDSPQSSTAPLSAARMPFSRLLGMGKMR